LATAWGWSWSSINSDARDHGIGERGQQAQEAFNLHAREWVLAPKQMVCSRHLLAKLNVDDTGVVLKQMPQRWRVCAWMPEMTAWPTQ
jgi:hypothetical protein